MPLEKNAAESEIARARATINPLQRSPGRLFPRAVYFRGMKNAKNERGRHPDVHPARPAPKLIWRGTFARAHWPIWIFRINSTAPRAPREAQQDRGASWLQIRRNVPRNSHEYNVRICRALIFRDDSRMLFCSLGARDRSREIDCNKYNYISAININTVLYIYI